MRGRKPKPVEQRIAEGNPGKRPLPEPMMVAGRPDLDELREPPDALPDDAVPFWEDTVTRLLEVGIVDRVDTPTLIDLAVCRARIAQSRRVIAQDGHFVRGSVGQLREHPALKIEREYTLLYNRLAEQFGLTPMARTRLGLAELHRRSLATEMHDALGAADLVPVDAEVVG